MASIGFLIVAAACYSAIFLKAPGVLWLALALLLTSMGIVYMIVRLRFGGLRAVWRAVKEGESEDGESTAAGNASDAGDYTCAIAAGSIVAAGVFFLAFFPATVWVAGSRGVPLIDVLLQIDVSNTTAGLALLDRIRLLLSDPVFFLPLGVFYAATLATRVLVLSLRAKPLLETSAMVFGLMVGYAAALLSASLIGSLIHPSLLTPALGVIYVLLLHYAVAAIAEYVPIKGMRVKYNHLLDGLESMGTAFILSRVYGPAAAIFGGAVFFVSSFLGASLWESTIGRLQRQVSSGLDEHPLARTWGEWQSLTRGDRHTMRRRAIRRLVLISSASTIAIPLLAYFLVRVFCGP